jgi:lipopolysaccharide export system protein LptC
MLVGKIETIATRILERAKNVYRNVEELQQTRANRVRTLVQGTYQLNSETSYIKSEKNVNIDGERIHLG